MKKVSNIVSFFSFAIILLTLNRKTQLTQGLLQPDNFLRWQDFHAMISIPLLITLVYSLLFTQITQRKKSLNSKFSFYLISFGAGVFLYGASSGNHEITNYLHHLFCINNVRDVCKIIAYNDDTFSHVLFYLSSIILTSTLLFYEYNQPEKNNISGKDFKIILFNAVLISLGIFINLAFEELGIDLYVFALLSIISLTFFWLKKKHLLKYPLIFYFSVSYGIGTTLSILYKFTAFV